MSFCVFGVFNWGMSLCYMDIMVKVCGVSVCLYKLMHLTGQQQGEFHILGTSQNLSPKIGMVPHI